MDLGKEISVGQSLTLDKGAFTGNKYYVGAGWDMADPAAKKIDGDLFTVELGPDGKWDGRLESIAFYKLPQHGKNHTNNETGSAKASEVDNQDGAGDGDDEYNLIDLDKAKPTSAGLAVCLNIFDGASKGQTFGLVNNCFVRLVRGDDKDGEAVAGLKLNPAKNTPDATAIEYVRFVRKGNGWDYVGRGKPLGDAAQGSRINTAAAMLEAI